MTRTGSLAIMSRNEAWRLAAPAMVIVLLACDRIGGVTAGCSKDGDCKGDRVCQSGQCVAPAAAGTATAAPAANAGTDPHTPVLSPDDAAFTDTRHGWGWSDKCWAEEHAGKYGWAMAACQRGLDLPGLDAKAKPSLLYNQGLALEGAGDQAGARGFYERSLGLRGANDPGRAEVAAALTRVGGTPPAQAVPTGQAPGLPGHTPFGGAPAGCGLNNLICRTGQKCCKDVPTRSAGWGCHNPDDPDIGICEP